MKKFVVEPSLLKQVITKNREYKVWARLLSEQLPLHNITERAEVIAFIAQCAHESAEFRVKLENLNYSKSALRRVFKKYFTIKQAGDYARQPERIANRVYANRMDNGDEQSGDGWKFRGHGIIQLTGKRNIKLFAKSVKRTIDQTLEYLETDGGALAGAIWFWKTNRLERYVDDFNALTRKINGGLHGLEDRRKYLRRADSVFSATFWTGPELVVDPVEDVVDPVEDVVKTPSRYPIIRLFSSGRFVEILHRILEKLGLRTDPNKFFSKRTFAAVRKVQKDAGLQRTGIVDTQTWDVLEQISSLYPWKEKK